MLEVHNILIGQNFEKELENVVKGLLPKTPPVYFYCPSAIDDSFCNQGFSSLNIMIRVPNLSFKQIEWTESTITMLRTICLHSLEYITKQKEISSHIVYEQYSTPKTLYGCYHYTDGAAFGIAPTLGHSVFLRPNMKSNKIKGLYFVGSSTHPGNGISIVMKGANSLANSIIKEVKK